MSILEGFSKVKRYRKTDAGYKLQSQWTSSETVEMADGSTLQDQFAALSGILASSGNIRYNIATDMIQIYDGSEWVNWRTAGTKRIDFINEYALSSEWLYNITVGTGGVSITAKTDQMIRFNLSSTTTWEANFGVAMAEYKTKTYIDLTGYVKLEYECVVNANNSQRCAICFYNENNNLVLTEDLQANSNQIITRSGTIDISNLKGKHLLGGTLACYSGDGTRYVSYSKLLLS